MNLHNIDWNTVGLAIIAIINAFNAFLSNRNHQAIGQVRSEVVEAKENVVIIEKATNSMKDALIASTAKASHAEGELKGRQSSRDELRNS